VLIDLADGHRPVDVLLGREADDFADWLRAHPGVQVICRDRAGGYADGARDGAPDAMQVADRWHLWDNLCRHVERLVAAHHACLPEPAAAAIDHGADDPTDLSVLQWPDTVRVANTRQRYQQLHDLRELGLSMRAIARRLNLNFKTVRRYVGVASVDVLLAVGVQVSVLDSFKPYLNGRLVEGERNATRLLAEITGLGYTGGYNTLARYLRPLRRLDAAALPPRPAPPAVRQVTGWITGLPSNLEPDDAARLQAIRHRCPEVDAAVRHVAGFARMIKDLVRRRGNAQQVDGRRRRRPTRPAVVHRRVAPRPDRCGRRADPGLQLRRRRGHRQPGQTAEGSDVRTRETRPPTQADTPGLSPA